MSGDLDNTSMLLGELKAELKEAARQREAMFKILDVMREQYSQLGGALKVMAEKQAALEQLVNIDIKPEIESYKALKNRGLGAIAFVGLASGALGAFFSNLVSGHAS